MKQYRTYNGNAPYLFVSYAHKDAERVLPFIEELDRNNYRLWYDAGINVGTNWPEVVASHLLSFCLYGLFNQFSGYKIRENYRN